MAYILNKIIVILIVFLSASSVLAAKPVRPISELEKLAEIGDSRAQLELGYKYFLGDGFKKDYLKAMGWYLKAAKQGEYMAMNNICYMYKHGFGVKKDLLTALQWCQEPAFAGVPSSMVLTAGIMWKRNGPFRNESVEFRDKAAFKLFKMAAERGHSHAQYMTGIFYEKGYAVKKDRQAALKWYRKAASQNHKQALIKLNEIEK